MPRLTLQLAGCGRSILGRGRVRADLGAGL